MGMALHKAAPFFSKKFFQFFFAYIEEN